MPKRSTYRQIQRSAYLMSRLMGDGRALTRGKLPKRLVRRSLTRSLFQLFR